MATTSKPPKNRLSNWARLGLFWAIIIFAALALFAVMTPHNQLKDVPVSQVIENANKGDITKIVGSGNDLTITEKGKDRPTQHSYIQGGISTLIKDDTLNEKAKKTLADTPPSTTGETLWNLAIIIVPVLLIAGFFMIMMRQAQGQNNQALGCFGPEPDAS